MGANASRQEIGGGQNEVEDYYGLLEVGEEATVDEIKVGASMYIKIRQDTWSLTRYKAIFQAASIETSS